MLTLQIASDLHLEEHGDGGRGFLTAMDPTGVDVLVLAGDILSARFATQVTQLFTILANKYPRILYVPGNHELWGSTPEEAMSVLTNALAPLQQVSLLNNQLVVVNGRRFLGGPMWFPAWGPLTDFAALDFSDFKEIGGFKPWAIAQNTRFKAMLEKNLQIGDVVLTHYLPSQKSVSPHWRGSAQNAFFVSEMDELILDRRPTLWIHGHTHDSKDYQYSDTRIVCNPRGLPKMGNREYVEKLLISIA